LAPLGRRVPAVGEELLTRNVVPLRDRPARLEIPNDLNLASHRVVLDRDEADEVLSPGSVFRERIGLQ
jgi:hypothetical protein